MKAAEYVFPVNTGSLNSFVVVLFFLQVTQTESIPRLSVTVAVTESGHELFRTFGKGICVITGFTVSLAIARKLYRFEGAPKGETATLFRESLVNP